MGEIPAAGDEVVALFEFFEDLRNEPEVIGGVRVSHHEVGAVRMGEAHQVGVAVAADGLVHHLHAAGLGDLDRAVGRAVVADDDLAVDACLVERGADLVDALAQTLLFVEDGEDDRDQRGPGAVDLSQSLGHQATSRRSRRTSRRAAG